LPGRDFGRKLGAYPWAPAMGPERTTFSVGQKVNFEIPEQHSGALALSESADPISDDLLGFAAGLGHDEFPCLSRTHSPSSCVPCVDFSTWLRERVRRADLEAVGEYLWRVREANPGAGGSVEEFRARFRSLAEAILSAPLHRHLANVSEEADLDLRVTLVLLAAHEVFSGFVMTGEAADFVAGVMAPHALELTDARELTERRNAFVLTMGQEMSYWSSWPEIEPEALPPLTPPVEPRLQSLLDALATLPLGARAHAVDALRHLSTDPKAPRTLASLSRYETRKRGLDVARSTELILARGLVVPATDLEGWIAGWTRRDLLAFLSQAGVGPRNSWNKERLAEVALAECAEVLRGRMADSGAVELAPTHAEGARMLREFVDSVTETWRVWLGFGTGIEG